MLVVAIVAAILAPLAARAVQMAISRRREYLADASSVELTRNPLGLASALEKIDRDQEVLEVANRATAHLYIANPVKKFEKRAKSVFSSHPPIQMRIQALRSMASMPARG
jgi:heat shock protein HtpX